MIKTVRTILMMSSSSGLFLSAYTLQVVCIAVIKDGFLDVVQMSKSEYLKKLNLYIFTLCFRKYNIFVMSVIFIIFK